jgi:hypothetical protein
MIAYFWGLALGLGCGFTPMGFPNTSFLGLVCVGASTIPNGFPNTSAINYFLEMIANAISNAPANTIKLV